MDKKSLMELNDGYQAKGKKIDIKTLKPPILKSGAFKDTEKKDESKKMTEAEMCKVFEQIKIGDRVAIAGDRVFLEGTIRKLPNNLSGMQLVKNYDLQLDNILYQMFDTTQIVILKKDD